MATSRYVVTPSTAIDFSPKTVGEEVVQCVRTIIATHVGTVPLHRAFGVSWDALDTPLPVARQLLRSSVVDAIQKFEGRARVTSVEWSETEDELIDGVTSPIVSIYVEDGDSSMETSATTGTTLADVYEQLDTCIRYTRESLEIAAAVFAAIEEIEATVYDTIYSQGSADKSDRLVITVPAVSVTTESSSAVESVCALIDAVRTVAAQIAANIEYYTKRFHLVECVDYLKIFKDGSATAGTNVISKTTPAAIASIAGTTSTQDLYDAAVEAYREMISLRKDIEDLRRAALDIEQTAFASIYGE